MLTNVHCVLPTHAPVRYVFLCPTDQRAAEQPPARASPISGVPRESRAASPALDSPYCDCGFTASQLLLPAMALSLISALAGYCWALLSVPGLKKGQGTLPSTPQTITLSYMTRPALTSLSGTSPNVVDCSFARAALAGTFGLRALICDVGGHS